MALASATEVPMMPAASSRAKVSGMARSQASVELLYRIAAFRQGCVSGAECCKA